VQCIPLIRYRVCFYGLMERRNDLCRAQSSRQPRSLITAAAVAVVTYNFSIASTCTLRNDNTVHADGQQQQQQSRQKLRVKLH